MGARAHPGLTTAEVEMRRHALGEQPPPPTSLPVRAILRRNVFTLINAITLGFLVLIVVAGAWADALFALIIAINALIGIVQELRAKRTLDRLALLPLELAAVLGRSLTAAESQRLFEAIVAGAISGPTLAAILAALKVRGETPDEIAGAAAAL
ncbi:MAG: hypothetical protein ACO3KD_09410, partial [Gaiellales bacterium]